jgi:drug/metabolite transporter (DMT)-like permease
LAAFGVVVLYLIGDLAFCSASVRGPVSIVNSLGGLYPIPAIAYSAWLLGDVPDAAGWTIIGLSLCGVVLIGAGVNKPSKASSGTGAMAAHPPAPAPTVIRIEELLRESLRPSAAPRRSGS